jgi:hypothetical protein
MSQFFAYVFTETAYFSVTMISHYPLHIKGSTEYSCDYVRTATQIQKQNHCTIPAQIIFHLWFSRPKSYTRQFCTMLFISATVLCHLCFDCYRI